MSFIFESTQNTRPILEGSLRFVRSDVPTSVSEAEREWLIAKGITTVVDLRTAEESAGKECPLAKDDRFKYYLMPVTGGNRVPSSVDDVSKSYIAMADCRMNEIISFMLSSDSNVLYFCNAGKDRTGVVSAILLYKLGVSYEYIISDYMESKENLRDMLTSYSKLNPHIDINVITPNEQYIKEFIEWYMCMRSLTE